MDSNQSLDALLTGSSVYPMKSEFRSSSAAAAASPKGTAMGGASLNFVSRILMGFSLVMLFFVIFFLLFDLCAMRNELNQLKCDLEKIQISVRHFHGNNSIPGDTSGTEDVPPTFSWFRKTKRDLAEQLGTDTEDEDRQKDAIEWKSEVDEPMLERNRSRILREARGNKRRRPAKMSKEVPGLNVFHQKAVHFHAKNMTSRTVKTQVNSPVMSWLATKWPGSLNQSFYHLRDGIVTIKEDGLYYIYAQLVFHDLSGRWSFSVDVNGKQELKCITSEDISASESMHPTNHGVYQHCYTSRLIYIRKLEQVTVKCLYGQRNLMTSREFTFWGIIQMS